MSILLLAISLVFAQPFPEVEERSPMAVVQAVIDAFFVQLKLETSPRVREVEDGFERVEQAVQALEQLDVEEPTHAGESGE
jgi:hypothetical protein